MLRTPIIFTALFASACVGGATTATLTPSQCAADWRAVGEADARDGAAAAKLDAYRAACARGGAALSPEDVAAWRRGFAEGAASPSQTVSRVDPAPSSTPPRRSPPRDVYRGPRVYPTFGVGVGVGSGGARIGSRVGVVVGVPIY